MKSTLILNANAQPRSLIPLSVESWQEAITGVYTGKLRPLHFYENWIVHSPTVSFQVPAVCILTKQVKVRHRFSSDDGGPQSSLVFLRDGYECQYCGKNFTKRQLTIDHVIPKSRGGKRTWQNTVAACEHCNFTRGVNEKIQPKTKPVRPTYEYLVKMSKKFPITMAHPSWNYYIGHSENLIKYVSPQGINSGYDFIPCFEY